MDRETKGRCSRGPQAAAGDLAAIALGLQRWRQIATWRDTETLAKHALEVTRENHAALDMLGDACTNSGRVAEELPMLRETDRLARTDSNVLSYSGRDALAALDHAVAIENEHMGIWLGRGRAIEARGRFDEARDSLEHAVRGQGDSSGA